MATVEIVSGPVAGPDGTQQYTLEVVINDLLNSDCPVPITVLVATVSSAVVLDQGKALLEGIAGRKEAADIIDRCIAQVMSSHLKTIVGGEFNDIEIQFDGVDEPPDDSVEVQSKRRRIAK